MQERSDVASKYNRFLSSVRKSEFRRQARWLPEISIGLSASAWGSDSSPDWQPWNLSQNFWFYGELLRQWTPYALSPMTVVWQRRAHPREEESLLCQLDARGLTIDADRPGFLGVKLDYSFAHQGRHLLMVRNELSHAADAAGYVSINPDGHAVEFPVYASQSGSNRMDIKVVGDDNYQLELKTCSARRMAKFAEEVLHEPGTAPDAFFLTDSNWNRGVARRWAGFFVPNVPEFSEKYREGLRVALSSGDSRRIIRVAPVGGYLNIYLDGEPLDAEEVGLPSKLRILADQTR